MMYDRNEGTTLSLYWLATRRIYQINGMLGLSVSAALITDSYFRQVTTEEATTKSTEMGILFMETSAKAGHNVKSLFKKIAMSLPGMEKEGAAATAETTAQNTSMDTFVPLT
jgi:hypothetical protein